MILTTLEIDELALAIEEKCTVHEADIRAVLTGLKNVVAEKVQNGYRVHLPRLGYFKIGLSTKGEVLSEDFSIPKNILRTRVIFQPEKSLSNGHFVNPLTHGVKYRLFNGLVDENDLSIIGQDIANSNGSGSGCGSGSGGNGGGDNGGDDTPVENRP